MIFNGLFNFFIDFKFDDIICNDKIKNNNLEFFYILFTLHQGNLDKCKIEKNLDYQK
jgi:hypothetical protein